MVNICLVPGCGRNKSDNFRRGLCPKHCQRRRRGSPDWTEKERYILENPPTNGIGKLPLGAGLYATLDEQDWHRFKDSMWCVSKWGYAFRSGLKCQSIYLHKEVLGIKGRILGDHINGDRLDNRRCNLRIASKAQNARNRDKSSKSGNPFKGITYRKKRGDYQARISFEGKFLHIGCSKNPIEAALYYDIAAQIFYGPFARLNFPIPSRF